MKRIDQAEYDALVAGAEILEEDANGLKVVILSDGTFLKLFRIKGVFSSTWIRPHATRFADNVAVLNSLRIPVPNVVETFWVAHRKNSAVQYEPLKGQTLRDLCSQEGRNSETLVKRVAEFIAGIHDKGVYFHSLHLGNILMLEDGSLGLIDVSDMKIQKKKLSFKKRIRNLTHLIRYAQDREVLSEFGKDVFLSAYLPGVSTSTHGSREFSNSFNVLWEEFEAGTRQSKR
jgi:tRNA A-37 threonylcarbamoyl transferase component Bud32